MTDSIAVIGEAVADATVLADGPDGTLRLTVRPGGGPANTAVALARLGGPVRFLGRLSTGVLGRLLREHLAAAGVDLSGAVPESRQATLAIAAVDERGSAEYDFYLDGTADWHFDAAELAAARGCGFVHTGSLALLRPPGAAAILTALGELRERAVVCVDPNVRPAIATARQYRDGIERWAATADILKLSTDDLDYAFPGASVEALCRDWHDRGCRLVVLTRGGDGATAWLAGQRVEVAAPRVTVVDTIGAGDAFTAGLLHRLRERGHGGTRLDRLDATTVAGAVELGCLVAARTCEVPGADPPWPDRLGWWP